MGNRTWICVFFLLLGAGCMEPERAEQPMTSEKSPASSDYVEEATPENGDESEEIEEVPSPMGVPDDSEEKDEDGNWEEDDEDGEDDEDKEDDEDDNEEWEGSQ